MEWPSSWLDWWNSSIAGERIISATSAPEAAAVCAPYQKQATRPRISAGMFAPKVPKDARASTGKGTPVLTPATPTSVISQ